MAFLASSTWSPPGGVTEARASWSNFHETTIYMAKLSLLCNSHRELDRMGYVTRPLTEKHIDNKVRCRNCNTRVKKRRDQPLQPGNPENKSRLKPVCCYHNGQVWKSQSPQNKWIKLWRCCGKRVSEGGCINDPQHSLPPHGDPDLLHHWQYHATPPSRAVSKDPEAGTEPNRRQGMQKKPKLWKTLPQSMPQPANAIALDCEMGTARTGETELIRLTAVDFFTQEVLLDRLVSPAVPMLHYNTRYSGVSRQAMEEAVKSGSCIFGKDAAREELWKFVGPETIVIAHGGQNDLSALRWIHPHIIDTCILESYTGTNLEGGHSLKNLCARKLGLVIQKGFGHDSIEDSLACRELCHFWAQQIPEIPEIP